MKKIIVAIVLIALIGIGAANFVSHDDSSNILDNVLTTDDLDTNETTDDLDTDENIDEDKYLNNSKLDIASIYQNTHKIKLNNNQKDISSNKTVKQSPITTDTTISKEDMVSIYTDMYSKLLVNSGGDKKAVSDVEVSDLKTFSNGTEYYTITVKLETENYSGYVKHDQIANIQPELFEGQDYTINGVVNMISYGEDEKQEVEDTYEHILNRSHNRYNRNFNQSSNDYYSLSTFRTSENNDLAYLVLVNGGTNLLVYSSDGYTYYDSEMNVNDDEVNETLYESLCRGAAESKIQSLDNSEYLSIGECEKIFEPVTELYKFDIIQTKDGISQKIGYITMDGYTRNVVELNIENSEVNNSVQTDETPTDNITIENEITTEDVELDTNTTSSD